MGTAKTKIINECPKSLGVESGEVRLNTTEERLNLLIAKNAEYENENSISTSEREKFEATLMENPLSAEKAYSYFGLLLGTFPPAAIFIKLFIEGFIPRGNEIWLIPVMVLVNSIAALKGYVSGKLMGKIILKFERYSWFSMLFILPFLGFSWGLTTGCIAGLFLFVVGALFGGVIGGIVGSFALPAFTTLHRLLKRDDKIDRKDFVPIALGITFVISAFILSFPL